MLPENPAPNRINNNYPHRTISHRRNARGQILTLRDSASEKSSKLFVRPILLDQTKQNINRVK